MTQPTTQPPADRAALRDRIAEVLWPLTDWDGDELNAARAADAVLAMLPAPADRAAVLREAAERIDNEELPQDYVDMFDNGARWAAKLLRRMADQAQQPPAINAEFEERRTTVEYFVQCQQPDGSWEQASSTSTDLGFATERLAACRRMQPDLKHRLARRTTTVVIEAQQPKEG